MLLTDVYFNKFLMHQHIDLQLKALHTEYLEFIGEISHKNFYCTRSAFLTFFSIWLQPFHPVFKDSETMKTNLKAMR